MLNLYHHVSCVTTTVADTIDLGNRIGAFLKTYRRPLCVALVGDLGMGKTHLSKGIGAGFGVQEEMTSPTFAIMNTYEVGRKTLYHFDVYRLESEDELENIGFAEFTDRTKSIVEWADKFPNLLPDHVLLVTITAPTETTRSITLASDTLGVDTLIELGGPYVSRD